MEPGIIPEEIKSRLPLIKVEHLDLFRKIQEHEHSPIWNYTCGDRINSEDFNFIKSFEEKLKKNRTKADLTAPQEIIDWVSNLKEEVVLFRENLNGIEIPKEFSKIKCMSREDIAKSLEKVVPLSASLDRLIVNSTSGTTGNPIVTPNHPAAIGCYTPLLLFVLEKHGIWLEFTKDNVGCMLICAQKETAVYSTVVPILNGTGFAKINLFENSWKNSEDRIRFIEDLSPLFLTGDPFSFSEFLKLDINYKPKAMVSTSMALSQTLREKLIERFDTKVIDYYSLNETGPLAYSCPVHPDEFHILPTDVYIEITDNNGNPLPENTEGEITVTGGRNPYIPLLRYKTGDRAKLKLNSCSCGDPTPRLYELEMRKQVLFYNKKDELINPIDITRIMKKFPILQYQLIQRKDLKCELKIQQLYKFSDKEMKQIKVELDKLFNNEIDLEIDYNFNTDGLKKIPYISEINN